MRERAIRTSLNKRVVLAFVPVFCVLGGATSAGALPVIHKVKDTAQATVDSTVRPVTNVTTRAVDRVKSTVPRVVERATAPKSVVPSASAMSAQEKAREASASNASVQSVTTPARTPVAKPEGAGVARKTPAITEVKPTAPAAAASLPLLTELDMSTAQPQSQQYFPLTATMTKVSSPGSAGSWIQPTSNGWQVFGVMWYWWMLRIALLYGAILIGRQVLWRFRQQYATVKTK